MKRFCVSQTNPCIKKNKQDIYDSAATYYIILKLLNSIKFPKKKRKNYQ